MLRALVFPLMAGIVGCGAGPTVQTTSLYRTQSRTDRITPRTPHSPTDTSSLADRVDAAKEGSLYCPFGDECEPALALISVATDEGLERCTGFLISETQVLTNDHCVAHSVAVENAIQHASNIPCQGLVYAHFAKTNDHDQALNISCQTIQVRSFQTGIGNRDYAILKLSQPVRDRAPLRLANRGFRANERASIYRVQMQKSEEGTFDGIQTRLECPASYMTMLYPSVTTPDIPLMTFGDCAIQAGNSGSAAINSDGQVGAIIQGYLSVKQDPDILNQLQPRLLDQKYGQVAIGTQIECIPELNLSRTAKCGSIVNMNSMMPENYLELFSTFNPKRLPSAGSENVWKTIPSSSDDEKSYLKVPACVSNQAKTGAQYPASEMTYRLGINRFLQGEWRAMLEPDEKQVNFKLTASSSFQAELQNDEFGAITLPVCSGQQGVRPRITKN